MSTARDRDRFSLHLPLFSVLVPGFQSHTIHCKLLANMVLVRIFLLSNVPWKWQLLPPFQHSPSDNGCVRWKYQVRSMTFEYFNHLQWRPISYFP